jgi:transposase
MRTILALDIGKFKTVACRITNDVSEVPMYYTRPSTPDKFRELFLKTKPTLVAIEACSLAGWVVDLCRELGIEIIVAHPGGDAWTWKRVKRKTDKDDAYKLARMARDGDLEPAYVPAPEQRQFKQLVKYRKKIQSQLSSIKNSIRALLLSQAIDCPPGDAAFSLTMFRIEMDKMARPLSQCAANQRWRGILHSMLENFDATKARYQEIDKQLEEIGKNDERVQRVQTIPGVGRIGAETIVAHIGDAKRFDNQRQVSAYAGLVPKQWQSGTIDRQNQITKRGPRLLRSQLTQVAWLSLRYNEYFNYLYLRTKGGSKSRKKQAIIAVCRKILVIAWAMLRDETDWKMPQIKLP